MKVIDFIKAFGVVVATLAITVAASFPMVAFYAFFIEPGQPEEFYNEAAQWIAPWSSHILGPVCFLVFNHWLVRVPAHDGHDSGPMADTVPAAWRTVFRADGGHFGGSAGTVSAMMPERCPR